MSGDSEKAQPSGFSLPADSANRLEISSYAKINFGLRVLARRPDGYHEIETIFQQVDLADRIILSIDRKPMTASISLTTTEPELPCNQRNLAYRAAAIFIEAYGRPVRVKIELDKRIPIGSGLGGGSSNAATVLMGLNALLGMPFAITALEEMAVRLGADVPFFLYGGCCHGTGIGERLTPLSVPLRPYIVVVSPDVSISTHWAFTNLKIPLTNNKNNFTLARFFLEQRGLSHWRTFFFNDFEPLVFGKFPELGEIKERLYEVGANYASLSGSGSAVYGLFDREEQAHDGVELFRPQYSTFLTRPIQSGMHELSSN